MRTSRKASTRLPLSGAALSLSLLLASIGGCEVSMLTAAGPGAPPTFTPPDAAADDAHRGSSIDLFRPPPWIAFLGARTYPAGRSAWAVTVADLNRDGLDDLITTDATSSEVWTFLAQPGGGFSPGARTAVGAGPRSVLAADFDEDGVMDILTANRAGDDLTLALGSGDGTFHGLSSVPVGGHPDNIVRADFDGDGKSDLAVATDSGAKLLIATAPTRFQKARVILAPPSFYRLAVVDVDEDGRLDLAGVCNYMQPAGVLRNRGGGTFGPIETLPVQSGGWVDSADLDGDGMPEIVMSDSATKSAAVFHNRGDGTFDPAAHLYGPDPGFDGRLADLDGDGRPDLINGRLYHGDAAGGFDVNTPVSIPSGGTVGGYAVGDFNGDGRRDIATTVLGNNESHIAVFLQTTTD